MTTVERLDNWKRAGVITDAQHGLLAALVRRERFSLFLEINALLYLGVLSLAGGLAWTFTTYFQRLGDFFILAALSALFAGSLYYCFSRTPAYSNGEVESPNIAFDYILYFACLVLSVELGYIEFRFEWLRDAWNNYLLFSSVVFFVLAYRFDNRFVLSLALSSLGGWFGIQFSTLRFSSAASLRSAALVYAFLVTAVGSFITRQGIKKHFLETYLHIAATVTLVALISGLSEENSNVFLLALLLVSAACATLGLRFKRFMFVVYGIVFGYIGLSYEVLRDVSESGPILTYFVVTGAGVILLVFFLARRFGREE
jgi:Predicted membrane protein (DUF2157)